MTNADVLRAMCDIDFGPTVQPPRELTELRAKVVKLRHELQLARQERVEAIRRAEQAEEAMARLLEE